MTDRELLEKLRTFLTYEAVDGLTAEQVEAKVPEYADALATQIGDAWKMIDDHLTKAGA